MPLPALMVTEIALPEIVAPKSTPAPVSFVTSTVYGPDPESVARFTVRLSDCAEPEGTAPKLTLTWSSATIALTAENRFARPAPMMLTFELRPTPLELSSTPWSAVFTMDERTCQAAQLGCWPITTAAAPARCGVDIDVPWKNAQQGGTAHASFGCELSTLTPCATTSGFTRKSTSVGP